MKIDEKRRKAIHEELQQGRRPYQRIYLAVMILSAIAIATSFIFDLPNIAAYAGLLFAAAFVALVYTYLQKQHTDKLIDIANGKELMHAESAIGAARRTGRLAGHSSFKNSMPPGFDDSNYP
jgi:hypothetical protein